MMSSAFSIHVKGYPNAGQALLPLICRRPCSLRRAANQRMRAEAPVRALAPTERLGRCGRRVASGGRRRAGRLRISAAMAPARSADDRRVSRQSEAAKVIFATVQMGDGWLSTTPGPAARVGTPMFLEPVLGDLTWLTLPTLAPARCAFLSRFWCCPQLSLATTSPSPNTRRRPLALFRIIQRPCQCPLSVSRHPARALPRRLRAITHLARAHPATCSSCLESLGTRLSFSAACLAWTRPSRRSRRAIHNPPKRLPAT
jgi:hypothetical protein